MSWLASKTKQLPDAKTPAIGNFRRIGRQEFRGAQSLP